jgi:sulfate adenylyltransferase subunit 1
VYKRQLLSILENIHIASDENLIDCRFPVQYVIRPNSNEYLDYRGFAGKVAGGIYKPGDRIIILPSGVTSKIKQIDTYNGPVEEAFPQMSVTLILDDDVDVSRGDMIVRELNQPNISQDIELIICWMNEKKLIINGRYIIRHTTREVKCIINEVRYKVDINTLHRIEGDSDIGLNDIARISIKTTKPLFFDKYKINRHTGSLIIIDESTNETVGAGMII